MIHLSDDLKTRVLSYLSPSDQSRVATTDQKVASLVRTLQNPTGVSYYFYSSSYTGTLRGAEIVRITPHLPNEIDVSRENSCYIISALARHGFEEVVLRDASLRLIETIPRIVACQTMKAFCKTGRITNPQAFREDLRCLFLHGMNTNNDLRSYSLSDSLPPVISEAILNPLLPYLLTAPATLEQVVSRLNLATHLSSETKQRCTNQLQPPAIHNDDLLVKQRKIYLYLHAYNQKPADGRFVSQMLETPYEEWGPLVEAWINDNNLATLALGSLLIPDQHLSLFHDAIMRALLRGQHALFHDMRRIASIWLNRFGFVLDPTSLSKETYHFKRLKGACCPLPPQLTDLSFYAIHQKREFFLHSYEPHTLDKADRYFALRLPSASIKQLRDQIVTYPEAQFDNFSGHEWYTAFPRMRQGDADILYRALHTHDHAEIGSLVLSLSEAGKANFFRMLSHEQYNRIDTLTWFSMGTNEANPVALKTIREATKYCLTTLAEPWTAPIRERWMKRRFQFTEAQYALLRFKNALDQWFFYCSDLNAVKLHISQTLESLPSLEKYLFFEELWKQINQTLPLETPIEDAQVWFEERMSERVLDGRTYRIIHKTISKRNRQCQAAAISPPFDIDEFILECDQLMTGSA